MKLMQSVISCFFVLAPLLSTAHIDSLQNVLVNLSEEERPVVLRQIGIEYIKAGHADSSVMYLETAKKLAEKYGQFETIASCHNNLGVAHHRLGNYAIAISYYKSAIELHAKMGTEHLAEQSKLNLGFAYKKLGLLDQAVKYLQEAIIYFEENGNSAYLASACSSMGSVHRDLKNYDFAIEYNQRALELRLSNGDTLKAAYSHHNLGMTYYDLGEFATAKEELEKALALKHKFEAEPQSIANTYAQLGAVALESEQWARAANHFRVSLNLSTSVDDKEGIASAYYHLCDLMVREQHPDSANWYLDTAFALAGQIDAIKLLLDISELGKTVAMQQRDFAKALQWSDATLTYTNTLLSEQNQQAIAEQNARYELYDYSKKLEGEIEKSASLTQKNDQLETTNSWLWVSVVLVALIALTLVLLYRQIRRRKSEVETLHREFQHRTMNYLQMLRTIFSIHIKNTNDPELEEVLKQYRSRVDAMSSVNKHLSSVTAKTIRLDDYLNSTVLSLIRAFDKPNRSVDLTTNFSDVMIDYDKAMKLGLIVNELVMNSMKYGLPTASEPALTVDAIDQGGKTLLVRVQDNGTGNIDGNDEVVGGSSLGKQLIELQAKSLKASVIVNTSQGYETVLEIPMQ